MRENKKPNPPKAEGPATKEPEMQMLDDDRYSGSAMDREAANELQRDIANNTVPNSQGVGSMSDVQKSVEIAPCPFCGHTRAPVAAHIIEFDDTADVVYPNYQVCCRTSVGGCGGAGGVYRTIAAAVTAWNRRAHAPQGAAPAPYAGHWAVKRPGLADQFRGEAVAARVALGLGDEKSDDVSPSDITEAIAKMRPLDQSCIAIWKDGTWMWTSERGAEEYSGDDNFLTWVKVGEVHQEAPAPGVVEALQYLDAALLAPDLR